MPSHGFGQRAAAQLNSDGLGSLVHDRMYAKAFRGAGGELQCQHVLTNQTPGFDGQRMAVDD